MKPDFLCLIAIVLLAPTRVDADVWDSATQNDNTSGTTENQLVHGRETTVSVARFNNAGSQITVLFGQNASEVSINVSIFYFSPSGVVLQTGTAPLAARNLSVVNTASFAPLQGLRGHFLIAHDAPYGGLNVKTVALEPATGFSFDTPGVYRGL